MRKINKYMAIALAMGGGALAAMAEPFIAYTPSAGGTEFGTLDVNPVVLVDKIVSPVVSFIDPAISLGVIALIVYGGWRIVKKIGKF